MLGVQAQKTEGLHRNEHIRVACQFHVGDECFVAARGLMNQLKRKMKNKQQHKLLTNY
jgi:hypothetical protein